MEDTSPTQPKAPVQPPTGRFMDVRAPDAPAEQQTDSETTNISEVTTTPIVVEQSQDAPEESSPETQAQTAPVPSNQNDVAISPDGQLSGASNSANPVVQENNPQSAPDQQTPLAESQAGELQVPPQAPSESGQPPAAHHASGAPVAAVVVAILVALVLSGLVIFAFMKSKDDAKLDNTTSSTNSKTTAAKPLASPADVDQTASDIDASLGSIDKTADFSPSDMSDQSLGL